MDELSSTTPSNTIVVRLWHEWTAEGPHWRGCIDHRCHPTAYPHRCGHPIGVIHLDVQPAGPAQFRALLADDVGGRLGDRYSFAFTPLLRYHDQPAQRGRFTRASMDGRCPSLAAPYAPFLS